jgi:two-component system, NarL family, nitrate/nitrite response regulator NarL
MAIAMAHLHQEQPIRVFLVDDHRTVLWGLCKLVESAQPRMELVGFASSSSDALASAARLRPDVILLDLDLGGDSGLELIAPLREHSSVLVLTGMQDRAVREQAMMEGARGVIHKGEPAEVILKAIAHVHAGEPWLDRGTMGRLLHVMSSGRRSAEAAEGRHAALTAAERKVIGAVVSRKSEPNKTIAAALNISEHTLRNHLSSIYGKLGLHRRIDLVLYAMENKSGSLRS